MNKIKFFFKQSWVLIVASFCFGLLIAGTNAALKPKIIQNQQEKINKLMTTLITEADNFERVAEKTTLETSSGQTEKTDIYKAFDENDNPLGYAFVAVGSGFADKIKLVIAMDENLEKCYGYAVLSSNETPGFGSKITGKYFESQFSGIPAGKVELVKSGASDKIDDTIVAISGATVSSRAVTDIFNNYIIPVKKKIESKGL
jgi:electron transport complex protein RnfG